MNNDRRKKLANFCESIEKLRASIEALKDDELEPLKEEEQEAFDNMPEGLQSGDRGQASELAINNMEDAISNIESALSELESAMSSIEYAAE